VKYFAPEKSVAFQKLYKLLESSKNSQAPHVEQVQLFLWLINAHPDLRAFGRVCENLCKVLGILQSVGATPRAGMEYISEWHSLSQWFAKHESILAEKVEETISLRPKSSDDHPLKHRGLGRHCLYAVLCNDHEDELLREKFSYLVGFYLMAYVSTMKTYTQYYKFISYSESKHIHFPNSPYNASLAIRDFSYESGPFMTDLVLQESPEELVDYCEQIFGSYKAEEKEKETLPGRIKAYAQFVAKGLGIKSWAERTSWSSSEKKGGRSGKRARRTGFLLTDLPDLDEDDIQMQGTFLPQRSDKPRNHLKKGIHTDEGTKDDEALIFVETPCNIAKKGGGRTAFAALGFARHVAMNNQMFYWCQNQLSMTQLCKLLEFCKEEYTLLMQEKEWGDNDLLLAELISLTHIMLWTGSPIRRALAIEAGQTLPLKSELYLLVKETDEEPPAWCMPAFEPEYSLEVEEDEIFTCVRGNQIELPDVRRSSFFVLETLKRNKGKIFSRDLKEYSKSLKTMLTHVDPTISLSQLGKFLFNAVLLETADLTLACEIVCKPHPLAGVRIFYSAISIEQVRAVYAQVVTKIADKVYSQLGSAFVPQSYSQVDEEYYVGSRLRARNESVVKAVASLQEKIVFPKTFPHGVVERRRFIEYHNAYTVYTVLFSTYATACRGIISPFIPSRKIILDLGVSTLADKDGDDEHKSRLIWLPNALIEQVQNYEAHCDTLFVTWQELKRDVREKECDCFFITPKGRCEIVSPKTIGKRLEKILPLPANSNRKYMRMELLERGCSPETVDVFMGHWYYGEEPFGQFSTFSFAEYIGELKQYLVPILEDLGFQAQPSILMKSI